METNNKSPFNAVIGSNNQNVNFYNMDETILKEENEKLKGMLRFAASQLCLKDKIIKIFSKRWNISKTS